MGLFDDVPNYDIEPNNDGIGENMTAVKFITLVNGIRTLQTVTKTDVALENVDNVQQLPMSYLSTATDLGGATPSDVLVPSQAAVKAYSDQLIAATGAMVFKGVIDAHLNPNYPAAIVGDVYKISVPGKIGGASGVAVELGDMVFCIRDTAGGAQGADDPTDSGTLTIGDAFTVVQTNIDGAVIGPASSVDDRIATFDGTSGKLIQDGGKTIATVLSDAASAANSYADGLAPNYDAAGDAAGSAGYRSTGQP